MANQENVVLFSISSSKSLQKRDAPSNENNPGKKLFKIRKTETTINTRSKTQVSIFL